MCGVLKMLVMLDLLVWEAFKKDQEPSCATVQRLRVRGYYARKARTASHEKCLVPVFA